MIFELIFVSTHAF